jgi:hypothetical protein
MAGRLVTARCRETTAVRARQLRLVPVLRLFHAGRESQPLRQVVGVLREPLKGGLFAGYAAVDLAAL